LAPLREDGNEKKRSSEAKLNDTQTVWKPGKNKNTIDSADRGAILDQDNPPGLKLGFTVKTRNQPYHTAVPPKKDNGQPD